MTKPSKTPTTKECGTCGEVKPLRAFNGRQERNGALPLGDEFKVPFTDCTPCWEVKAKAATLIREHLWQGETPPSPFPKDPRPWTMNREMTIWGRLFQLGHDPEEINGAIKHIRDILTKHEGVPLRLTTIYNAQGYATPVYEQARAKYIKSLDDVPYGRKVRLPPTVKSILRGMSQ